jgi:hypothetical protein
LISILRTFIKVDLKKDKERYKVEVNSIYSLSQKIYHSCHLLFKGSLFWILFVILWRSFNLRRVIYNCFFKRVIFYCWIIHVINLAYDSRNDKIRQTTYNRILFKNCQNTEAFSRNWGEQLANYYNWGA